MNYGHRQERAEQLVKAFREKAAKYPDVKFKDRTFLEWADEIERQTEGGRELVYLSSFIFRALESGPDPAV